MLLTEDRTILDINAAIFPLESADDARTKLILAAEKLFAQEGIESASLRQIAAIAGNGNNNAVKYHFGDRDGIVEALLNFRVSQMEPMRFQMLAEAQAGDKLRDLSTLMKMYCLPQLSLINEEGRYPYASFLLQFLMRHKSESYVNALACIVERCPAIGQIRRLILDALPLEPHVAENRIALSHMMFLNMVVRLETHPQTGENPSKSAQLIVDSMAMVVAALSVPMTSDEEILTLVGISPKTVMSAPPPSVPPVTDKNLLAEENKQLRHIVAQLTLEKYLLSQKLEANSAQKSSAL